MAKKKAQKKTTQSFFVYPWLKNTAYFIVYFLVAIFVGVNIGASQLVPKEYMDFVNGDDKQAFAEIIKKTKKSEMIVELFPEIKENLQENQSLIFAETQTRREKISKLKDMLKKSPEDPQILYALYQLYLDEENGTNQSQEYLNSALKIDPQIGNNL